MVLLHPVYTAVSTTHVREECLIGMLSLVCIILCILRAQCVLYVVVRLKRLGNNHFNHCNILLLMVFNICDLCWMLAKFLLIMYIAGVQQCHNISSS